MLHSSSCLLFYTSSCTEVSYNHMRESTRGAQRCLTLEPIWKAQAVVSVPKQLGKAVMARLLVLLISFGSFSCES